jgi:hypothetical protein
MEKNPMLKPYSNQMLKRLPRNAYAYSNDNGISWTLRKNAESVESVIHRDNNQPLVASDYYAEMVDSLLIANAISARVPMSRQIESDYNG